MKTFATVVLAGAAFAGVAMSVATPAHADGALARHNLVLSLGLLTDGNFNAARSHAEKAIQADPKWGLAHAMLARTYLALGDGVGAEAELGRAAANGFDMRRGHQMLAQAWLLQGDAKRALVEAARADQRFGGYAARVTAKALAMQGKSPDAIALLGELLDGDPNSSYAWSDLARIRYNAGDIAGASANAQRAVSLDPNNLEALTLRGELMREQYGLAAAVPWFEGALKRDAYYYPALIEYAATLGDLGRYTDMLGATRKALAARPGNPQALYLQAVLAARAQNYDLARGLMQRTRGAIDDMPGVLLLGGTLDYQAGAYEQAIEKWRELVGRQPMNVTARRLLGAALLRSGDAKGALDVLRPVALRGDADSYTLALVGRAFEANGERDWAAKFLDRSSWPAAGGATPFGSDDGLAVLANAANNDPRNPILAVGMVRGLIDAGQTGAALDKAKALAAANPGAPAAHLLVGDTLMTMGRYGDAAAAYARAGNIKFNEAVMLRMVDAFDHAGRRPEASRALALFLGQHPENVPALRLAAHWQIAAGDWDGAMGTLEDLRSRVGSRDAGLLAELTYANIGAQNYDDALDYGAAAYEIAPMSPAATDAYGWAYYAAGDSGKAKDLLEKAVSLAPRQPGIRWHLAQAYADLGRNADAKAQIAVALGDPSFTDRAPAQALLKTLG
jgi:tetratricopeptide (TPR) repeat protein